LSWEKNAKTQRRQISRQQELLDGELDVSEGGVPRTIATPSPDQLHAVKHDGHSYIEYFEGAREIERNFPREKAGIIPTSLVGAGNSAHVCWRDNAVRTLSSAT